jgi:hypothetical protein
MSNYSYATSYEPYKDNSAIKRRQADEIMAFIVRGGNNLLQLAQLTGLPQSTVSGRISNLLEEKRIEYSGHTIYAGADGKPRKRKRIVPVKKIVIGKQVDLFLAVNE